MGNSGSQTGDSGIDLCELRAPQTGNSELELREIRGPQTGTLWETLGNYGKLEYPNREIQGHPNRKFKAPKLSFDMHSSNVACA